MEEKHVEELIESIKLAQSGDWMPASIIAGLFGIIIFLIIIIWRRSENYHHAKHKENDDARKEYEKQMTNLAIIVTKHEVEIEHLKG